MENNRKSKTRTFDEALEMPELAHFHEAIIFLKNKPTGTLFPAKYAASVEHLVVRKVMNLREETPAMPLKSVISRTLDGLPDNLPDDLLLKMTRLIIDEWQTISTAAYAEKGVEELV